MLSLRKRTVEKRNYRGDIVRKEEVVTFTKKLHGSTKAEAKGGKLQRPPIDNYLQPVKLALPPPSSKYPFPSPPTTPMFTENMCHPVIKGTPFHQNMNSPKGNRGELFQRQGYAMKNFNRQKNNQGNDMVMGKKNNLDFVHFESSKRQDDRASLSAFMANPKANVYAEDSDAEGSDAKESEADNIISSEESEAESEAEDTNSEEFEAEESEAEPEAESEAESEAENTNSEESDEAEDSDDEPPRRSVDMERAMRNLSMQSEETMLIGRQKQDTGNYNAYHGYGLAKENFSSC